MTMQSAGARQAETSRSVECRACRAKVATAFCGRCGSRVLGDPFETVSHCLIPRNKLDEIWEAWQIADPGHLRSHQFERAFYAAEDLNRAVLAVSDALRRDDAHDLERALERTEAERILEDLVPAGDWGELRVNVWTLVSDIEQQCKAKFARLEYERERERARKHTYLGKHKQAAEAWRSCLFWLENHWHPEAEAMKAEAAEQAAASK